MQTHTLAATIMALALPVEQVSATRAPAVILAWVAVKVMEETQTWLETRIHTPGAMTMDPGLPLVPVSATRALAATRALLEEVCSGPSCLSQVLANAFVPTDSKTGKFMEKIGGMMGNEKIEQKGLEKREQAGYGQSSDY